MKAYSRNMMLIVVLIIAAMALSLQAQLTEFYESWEDGYPDWYSDTNKAYYQIIDTDSTDGSYCLRYATLNGKEIHRSIGSADAFEISWDYKGDETGGAYDLNWVFICNSGGESRVQFYQRNNQSGAGIELGFWNTAVSATVAADTWVHNQLIIQDETCTWYLNSNLIGSVPLIGSAATPCTEVRLHNGGTLSEGYIDVIDVKRISPQECGDPLTEYNLGDIGGPGGEKDCYVDLYDLNTLGAQWLKCADPCNPDCDAYWQNAYDLQWGGPDGPCDIVTDLELSLGVDEYEAVEMSVSTHDNLGQVTVGLAGSATIPAGSLILGLQQATSNPDTQYTDDSLYGISYVSDPNTMTELTMDITAMETKSFWIKFNANLFSPGDHSFNLEVQPRLGPVQIIPVTLHVYDAQRAPQNRAALNAYHTYTYINSALSTHSEIMHHGGVDQLMVHFPFNMWETAITVTRDAQNDLQVDFTNFDNYMQTAMNNDFPQLAFMYSYYRNEWFTALDYESEAQKEVTRQEFGTALAEHLLELGFRGPAGPADANEALWPDPNQLWYYALDEPAIATLTDPSTLDYLNTIKSLHSAYKTHSTLNHYDSSMVAPVNPYLDIWTGTLGLTYTLVDDIDLGTVAVDADDKIGFYGQGRYFSSPDDMRAFGWQAGHLAPVVTHYTIFAYEQSPTNADWKMFVTDAQGNVYTSCAWEGLREGYEEFGYWQNFEQLLAEAVLLAPGTLTTQELQDLQNAEDFKDAVFGINSQALIQIQMVAGTNGWRDWPQVSSPNRWEFLSVKQQLLQHIQNLNQMLEN